MRETAHCPGVRFSCRLLIAAVVVLLGFPADSTAKQIANVSELHSADARLDLRTTDGAKVRIEFLRPDLFRIWVGPDGELTGEGSGAAPIVLPRKRAAVTSRMRDAGAYRLITTTELALRVYKSPLRFELYRPGNREVIWKELKPLFLDEDGSHQTLASHADERFFGGGQQNGSFEFKNRLLEVSYSGGWEEGDRPSPAPFYMSNAGYGVLRNTWSDGTYDFRSEDYLVTRHHENRFDAYYFVGDSIREVLELYTELTGRAQLLPRWAFEYGDADCYNDGDNIDKPGTTPDGWSDGPTGTTPDVVESVAARYRQHDMPGGWILPNDGYGCGYTDLPGVVAQLRGLGFHTGLWTEDGVEKIAWEVGSAGTRAQKLDVAWTGKGHQFALDANMAAARGILDNSDGRPFLWTVMGWAGIQRYAVTWTGDQSGSWNYIRWHVPTLIGSGLSGQAYATGDVDGIFGGSPETFTRDLQWKSFTPVLMGMSGWSSSERKHPWWFDDPHRSIHRKYLKLKMRLMPYVYTFAWQTEQTGAPIVRGLAWDHGDDAHAHDQRTKYQFFLGTDLLVAPVFRSQAASGGWRDDVYLPEGVWIDYWDGTLTRAGPDGIFLDYPVTLDRLPLLVRGGTILPMYPEALYDGQVAKTVLTLDIYPHGASDFTLYEDDGNTRDYKNGAFSLQRFSVSAPIDEVGDIAITLEAATGRFEGMSEQRIYDVQVHTRAAPTSVTLDGRALPLLTAPDGAASGWRFDPDDRHGVTFVKTPLLSVRREHEISIAFDEGTTTPEDGLYPARPERDAAISADDLTVITRPAEEPGHPLENAFDGDPDTWFRTVRDQSVKSGPHEFVLSLGGRREVEGVTLQPRNDKYWKYGNVRHYEIYLGDVNGRWGEPVTTGMLELNQESQTIRFESRVARLLRFRVLSTHDMGSDPMVLGAADDRGRGAYNASDPVTVDPTTISEFRVLERRPPDRPRRRFALSGAQWQSAENGQGPVEIDRSNGGAEAGDGSPLKLNGLVFTSGLGVCGASRIDYPLSGHLHTFRAEAGIDEESAGRGTIRFQVHGDRTLLFDSGVVDTLAVVKPQLDIRGIKTLSLRTLLVEGAPCANWVNPTVLGYAGDRVGASGAEH